MGFTQTALSGASWHTVFKVGATVITLVKLAILGRLLGPYAFGLFSLTTIALGVMEAATETGINVVLVQSPKPISHFLNTAWVIACIRGALIAGLMVILGFVLSNWYSEPQLLTLILLAAFVPLIKGFINPAITSYYKKLEFLPDAVYRLTLVAVDAIFAIALSWYLGSAYVFVWAMIITALFEVVISFVAFKEKPKFAFSMPVAKEIFSYSKGLTIATLFDYLHENLDNVIIGKQFSTTTVGFYQNAYGFGHKVTLDVTQSAYHSTMPIYGRFADDVARLKRAFLRTIVSSFGVIAVLSAPFLLYPQVVVLILGSEWQPAVPLVVPLTLAGMTQSVALLQYGLFITKKSYFWLNAHKILSVVVLVGSLLILGSDKDISTISWLIFAGRVVVLPVALLGTWQVLKK